MNAIELIEKLSTLVANHGDLPVRNDMDGEIFGVEYNTDEEEPVFLVVFD